VPREERVGDQTLRILSPTDCVRDRLANAIHFRARECPDQAALVAAAQDIDWPLVEAWRQAEGPAGRQAYEDLHRIVAGGQTRTGAPS
jgi:hypothetical protein